TADLAGATATCFEFKQSRGVRQHFEAVGEAALVHLFERVQEPLSVNRQRLNELIEGLAVAWTRPLPEKLYQSRPLDPGELRNELEKHLPARQLGQNESALLDRLLFTLARCVANLVREHPAHEPTREKPFPKDVVEGHLSLFKAIDPEALLREIQLT